MLTAHLMNWSQHETPGPDDGALARGLDRSTSSKVLLKIAEAARGISARGSATSPLLSLAVSQEIRESGGLVSKLSVNLRKVFYFLTGQRRLRKLEARLKRLEHDHYALAARFTVTVSLYEQRIDTLVNSVARTFAQGEKPAVRNSREDNTPEFAGRKDVGERRL